MPENSTNRYAELDLNDFVYDLPEERIAKYPIPTRDLSKLLIYRENKISHDIFRNLNDYLPDNSLLVFNNTKVIPARINFHKATGALIEVFLLQPVEPSVVVPLSMEARGSSIWKCMIRNLRKWKDSEILISEIQYGDSSFKLSAEILNQEKGLIKFRWDDDQSRFVDVLEATGKVPLPPYIKREAEETDKIRYQTVYSKYDGAVAAPTAGLHFTDEIQEKLIQLGHSLDYLTLHVSAGTFQPIKENRVTDHPMHAEQVVIKRENIEKLVEHKNKTIAVGTTSMRTLESLYWYGVKLLNSGGQPFGIDKLYPYQFGKEDLPSRHKSLTAVIEFMNKSNIREIMGQTEIFIFPGYIFRICDGLITNYHMPRSTLILLVAAFVGKDWKKIYEEALNNDYRFLSYGDSSMLLH
ncbi:S-adenosylmethionine:tRNA ribosyltransferase-isomerase [Bacteroidota bacterium]